jgi:hydrophobe/amphiphile efflux-1 (HAE1) family protein
MTLSEISIKNPVFAWMLMIGLMFFGWIGFSRMGVSQMPDVDFPVITVSLGLEGAAPEIMETEVVDVVEDAIMSIQGVRNVSSSAREGSANITIEFDLDRNIDLALQEVQAKVEQAKGRLPKDIDPPLFMKTNPEDHPVMWVGLSSDDPDLRKLMDYAQDNLKPLLQTVSGVGDVIVGGFLERNLRVWVEADELSKRELTVDDVLDAIQNQHQERPAGRIESLEKEHGLRVMGEAVNLTEFSNILIADRGGRPIFRPFRLSEVAKVEDGLSDLRRIARINGKTSIGLGIKKQRGSNAVAVADAVKERLKDMEKRLLPGMKLGVNFDSSRFIKSSIAEMNYTLVLSAILTSIVCWLFLGSFGATLNVLFAIPTSLLGTFLVLYFLDYTLNMFTLLGLTLAIGIVVDDAIMVIENITRHREMGKSAVKGSLDGANEITFAAIASTIAIVAIFLPVAFMQGIIGKFFAQFGVTISVAVGISLLEALTLAPMRTSQFVKRVTHKNWISRTSEAVFHRFAERYRSALSLALRWRWVVVIVSVALFVGSLQLIRKVPKELSPAQDQSMFMTRLQAPLGSSIEFTNERFKRAEAWLMKQPEVERYFAAIGGFGGGEVDTGIMFVTLKQPDQRERTQQEFIDVARKGLTESSGIRAMVQDLSRQNFAASGGYPVDFTIRGPEWDVLEKASKTITDEMARDNSFLDIDTDYRTGLPEFRIIPDRAKAAARGVSMDAIGRTISATVGGVVAGKYTKGGRRYDIRVRLVPKDRTRAEQVKNLLVRNNRGEVISLSELVQIGERPVQQALYRENRERAINIFSNLPNNVSQAAALQRAEEIAKKQLPDGYHLFFEGGSKAFQESFKSLLFAFWVGIAIAYMVLASQFNSFLHPFTVLLALPFSVTGGLLALLVGKQSINVYSVIGLLLLMGILKNNSILLVDFTNKRRRDGLKPREALLDACPTRLRPILMTSIATIAAAIPPALAFGPGAETRIPMAIVVIGGVLVSTLLTLFVVPCAYEILSPLERSGKRTDEYENQDQTSPKSVETLRRR